jgi:hypothetical protein
MTQLIFDGKDDILPDLWTTERLKEEFFLCLTSVREVIVPIKSRYHPSYFKEYRRKSKSVTVRKYYRQAREIIYLIPSWTPSPAFVIYLSDLNSRIKEEFMEYCRANDKRNVTLFLKEVAGRYFENLDYEYYHGSVMRMLNVRLEQ